MTPNADTSDTASCAIDDLRYRRKEVEAALSTYGYQMDYDLGAIPGEGHAIKTLTGMDVDSEALPAVARELARTWSDLTDQLEDLVFVADELIEPSSPRP